MLPRLWDERTVSDREAQTDGTTGQPADGVGLIKCTKPGSAISAGFARRPLLSWPAPRRAMLDLS